jgi:hypothetical protein
LRTLRAGNGEARQIGSRTTGNRENRRPAASQSETGERARCDWARIGRSHVIKLHATCGVGDSLHPKETVPGSRIDQARREDRPLQLQTMLSHAGTSRKLLAIGRVLIAFGLLIMRPCTLSYLEESIDCDCRCCTNCLRTWRRLSVA